MNEVLKKYLNSLNAHSVEKVSFEEYRNEMHTKERTSSKGNGETYRAFGSRTMSTVRPKSSLE